MERSVEGKVYPVLHNFHCKIDTRIIVRIIFADTIVFNDILHVAFNAVPLVLRRGVRSRH